MSMASARLGVSGWVLVERRARGCTAFIGYLPVGYPSMPASLAAMRTLVAAGADIVEIGMPYSDPVMNGPAIQYATSRALARGVRTRDSFVAARAVAEVASFADAVIVGSVLVKCLIDGEDSGMTGWPSCVAGPPNWQLARWDR